MPMSDALKQRLRISLLLFLDLAGLSTIVLLVGAGGFDQPPGLLAALVAGLGFLALGSGLLLPVSLGKSLGIHGVLVIGSLIFMFPFAWLVITSFKYPEEVVAYPPKWVPAVPRPMARSPFVTAELYDEATPPDEITEERWEHLQPIIERTLWEQSLKLLDAAHLQDLPVEALRPVLFQALWNTLAPAVPAEVWKQDDDTLIVALARRVTLDRLEDVWTAIYRCVAIRAPFVTDRDQRDHALDAVDADTLAAMANPVGGVTLRTTPLNLRSSQTMLQLAYHLREERSAGVTVEVPLPINTSDLLSVTLPLRQDRTWHRLFITIEMDGRRYASQDALYLSGYRWQELSFKLADRDATDERDLGVWPATLTSDQHNVYNRPGHLRLGVEIERTSRGVAMWRKYTHNYRNAWIAGGHWDRYITNSVYLVLMNVLGQLLACSMVAYAFSRLRWPGRDILFLMLLATMMLPPQVTMVPVFLIFRTLGWYNTLRPLWVPAFAGGAFFIFLLRQFMKGIPRELEEAALIDGCGYFGIYSRIIVPLIKPALAAVGIFTFINAWNDFMGPLIYLNDQRLYPLALGLFNFRDEFGGDFGMLMAASTIMILPVVVIFFFAQKYFIQGVTLTGMKN